MRPEDSESVVGGGLRCPSPTVLSARASCCAVLPVVKPAQPVASRFAQPPATCHSPAQSHCTKSIHDLPPPSLSSSSFCLISCEFVLFMLTSGACRARSFPTTASSGECPTDGNQTFLASSCPRELVDGMRRGRQPLTFRISLHRNHRLREFRLLRPYKIRTSGNRLLITKI